MVKRRNLKILMEIIKSDPNLLRMIIRIGEANDKEDIREEKEANDVISALCLVDQLIISETLRLVLFIKNKLHI